MPEDGAAIPLKAASRADGVIRAWTGLAVAALAVAGVFALLLAASRTPGMENVVAWPAAFFHKGLVIHVVFSFVVWFTAMLGALLAVLRHQPATGRGDAGWADRLAPAGVLVAFPLLFVPALLDRGLPTLNNYVPAIIDPLYYAGLVVLAAAVAVACVRALLSISRSPAPLDAPPLVARAACFAFTAALVCFAAAWMQVVGTPVDHGFNEYLMWGGGHVLQIVNTLIVILAWLLLGRTFAGDRAPDRRPIRLGVGVLVLAAAIAPLSYLVFEPFTATQTRAFTALQYTLGPSALIAAWPILRTARWPLPWGNPAFAALALSLLLFCVGGALGLFVDGTDTRTPAHYHGVIASVTIALMGTVYTVVLPRLDRVVRARKTMLWQLHLFCWGQLVACLGLFIAGGHGAPRKAAGEAQALDGLAQIAGMAMNGVGGAIAVIGGVIFVIIAANGLLRAPDRAHHAMDLRAAGPGNKKPVWRAE